MGPRVFFAEFRTRQGRDPTRWEHAALTREAAVDTRARKSGNAAAHLRSRWLPADYTIRNVRLGYAATEHGNQSDTVTASTELVTPATTRRGLYVGVTRGPQDNMIRVVTDTPTG